MRLRWITAIIGISLTIGIFWISARWHELPMLFLVLAAGLLVNYEIMNIAKGRKTYKYPFFTLGILMTLSITATYLMGMHIISGAVFVTANIIFFMVFFYIALFNTVIRAQDIDLCFEHLGYTLLSYITLVVLLPQIFLIKTFSLWALMLLFGFAWFNDAFALFIGMSMGRHKLPMLPSRSKTLEGYIGAFILTTAMGGLFYAIQGAIGLPFHWTVGKWLLFGACMSFSSHLGDLIESLIKRWGDKKDSGTMLPGMGGLFDAIDSQIYSIPVALVFFFSR